MTRGAWPATALACLSLLLLGGCLGIDFTGGAYSCYLPEVAIADSQLIGTWRAIYDDYHDSSKLPEEPDRSEPISGTDTLVLRADGTYSQRFVGEDGATAERDGAWRRIDNEGDGIKLELSGMAYLSNGLASIDGPLHLRPQTFDELRYQRLYGNRPPGPSTRLSVNYPADGYLFLYPRICYDSPDLVLVQMAKGAGDPDNTSVQNPPFRRVDGGEGQQP